MSEKRPSQGKKNQEDGDPDQAISADNPYKRPALEINAEALRNNTDTLGIQVEIPKFPQYAILKRRKDSYKNWPPGSVSEEKMVEAGFAYTGKGDCVRCYHCGGGLRSWEPGDDPWIEHAKWYPKCPHVILSKGQEFIDSVRRGENPYVDLYNKQKEWCKKVQAEANQVEDNQVERDLNSDGARICLAEGYSKDQVLKAINILQENNYGKTDWTSNDIRKIILEQMKDQIGDSSSSSDVHCSGGTEQEQEEEEVDSDDLHNENQRLKKMQLCKVCYQEKAIIAFLPCGHIFACPDCAAALEICAFCREVKKASVRVAFQ